MRVSEAAQKLAKAKLDRARIFPPIAGVLNDVLVEKGEFVQSGQAVAEIVEIDKVKVVAPVPEHDVPFLKVNDRAVVLIDDRTNGEETVLRLVGAITYISKLADERTRATRVEIALDNKGRKLQSGRIVRVQFIRQVLTNVTMVPLSAVIPLENSKAVYVVETVEDEKGKRDVARRREVRVNTRFIKTEGDGGKAAVNGRQKQQMIQILPWPSGDGRRGLRDGDRLIVAGHQSVAPGQRVIIREAVAGRGRKAGGDTPR